jgi:hypothetical protein
MHDRNQSTCGEQGRSSSTHGSPSPNRQTLKRRREAQIRQAALKGFTEIANPHAKYAKTELLFNSSRYRKCTIAKSDEVVTKHDKSSNNRQCSNHDPTNTVDEAALKVGKDEPAEAKEKNRSQARYFFLREM